jgi:ABC-type phosphate transport system substrate-binding protein
MMHTKNRLQLIVIGLLWSVLINPVNAELLIVVSAKSPVDSLTPDQATDIFLNNASKFPSGGMAVPIDQSEASAVRAAFYVKAAAKSPAQMKAYWSKLIFTGKGRPPKEVPDSAAVKKLIADNPNLIGYIDKSELDASVKVVATVK